jgi:hypothetical protein
MQRIAWTLEAFRAQVEETPTGCHLWTGRTDYTGYVRVATCGKQPMAHRLVYELAYGEIPVGMVIDHLCHTRDLACPGGFGCAHRRCLNPEHLEPITARENFLRGRRSQKLAAITHCPQGHPYEGWNLILRKDRPGGRECRACTYERTRKYEARRKARNEDSGSST